MGQDSDQWQTIVNTIMKLRFPCRLVVAVSGPAELLSASGRSICTIECLNDSAIMAELLGNT